MQWYDASDQAAQDRILGAWSDAPVENVELLDTLLDVAREQVLEYAPEGTPVEQVQILLESLGASEEIIAAVTDIVDGLVPSEDQLTGGEVLAGTLLSDPPARYVYAQLQQAKNLWYAGRASSEGDIGGDGFVFTPRPLDRTIQRIIRPTTGAPNVL